MRSTTLLLSLFLWCGIKNATKPQKSLSSFDKHHSTRQFWIEPYSYGTFCNMYIRNYSIHVVQLCTYLVTWLTSGTHRWVAIPQHETLYWQCTHTPGLLSYVTSIKCSYIHSMYIIIVMYLYSITYRFQQMTHMHTNTFQSINLQFIGKLHVGKLVLFQP